MSKLSDLVLSHPPYHDIIPYSGSEWGREPHADDLSRCATADQFMDKLYIALLNQRTATMVDGHYGHYFSPQAEIIARMPQDELRSVLIKAQHNMAKQFCPLCPNEIPDEHEYVVLWQKSPTTERATST